MPALRKKYLTVKPTHFIFGKFLLFTILWNMTANPANILLAYILKQILKRYYAFW